MATTTPNYGWPVPTSTDYVKDGAVAIEALGDAIDATVFALPKGGLVPITPTSISVGSGTATSAGNGQVTFTGVGTNLSLNGVFSATYTNYLVLLSKVTASGVGGLSLRLRSGSTDNTSAVYDSARVTINDAGTVSSGATNNATSFQYNINDQQFQYFTINLFSPFVTDETGMQNSIFETNPSNFYTTTINGQHQADYSADGLTFLVNTGTATGKVSVYGYAK